MATLTLAHLVLSTAEVKQRFRKLRLEHPSWSFERLLKTAWEEDEMCDDGARLVSVAVRGGGDGIMAVCSLCHQERQPYDYCNIPMLSEPRGRQSAAYPSFKACHVCLNRIFEGEMKIEMKIRRLQAQQERTA